MDTLYKDLGLKPVINASATLTRLGGSRMPQEVLQAMTAAAESFIDLNALQERVGDRIAELTNNEACYVSSGAAAGIMLSVASCIAGTDPANTFVFPHLDGLPKTEVIVQKVQRNGYDYADRPDRRHSRRDRQHRRGAGGRDLRQDRLHRLVRRRTAGEGRTAASKR